MAKTETASDPMPAAHRWSGLAFGTALIFFALLIFVFFKPAATASVSVDVIGGFALLMLSLAGLIIVSQTLGLTTPKEALGLPSGSVRALMAFSMVIAFIAIASWTLADHGMSGSVVDSEDVNPDASTEVIAKMAAEQAIYPAPRFLTVLNRTAKAVQVVDSQGQQQLFDLQKQILTIIATALVTIIGFYFGSKSSADAAAAATTTVSSVTDALANAPRKPALPPPTLDSLTQIAIQIRALATAAKGKLDGLGADPMADLKQAVTSGAAASLQATLADAQAALDKMTKGVSATASFADNAEAEIKKLTATSDADVLATSQRVLDPLRDSATSAGNDVDSALAAFTAADTAIRSATADG